MLMIFRFLVSICFGLYCSDFSAQNFTFDPGADYSSTLEMEMYTEHYIYVYHDLSDSAHISWRRIENTCPSSWDIQMCDWQHCYSGIPDFGDMNAVGVGNPGNIRLIVNPFNTPGSGFVQFWIFPTGNMDEHVDVFFYFETIITGNEVINEKTQMVYVFRDELVFSNDSHEVFTILNGTGVAVKSFTLSSENHHESIADLAPGVYFCNSTKGTSVKFIKL